MPAIRRYCDTRCARLAWLRARAYKAMTVARALDITTRRLGRNRMPAVAAACDMLVALRDELAYSEEACRAQLAVALVRTSPVAA